ncbi:MAG TPA: IPT/TIG domain-containing protein, partial [Caldilineaceae bacterium]|nr:IPT/TIG domain-containing protein [Caldilineaceae bacterium]
TIQGVGFGATQGAGQVTLDGTIVLPTTGWSDTNIAVTVPANTPIGPHQLSIKAANGQSTINGLTFHVLGTGSFGPMPSNAVLDTFSRGNTNNGFGNPWNDDTPNSPAGQAVFIVDGNQARVRTGNNVYTSWWGNTNFGANQEAYFTFVQVSNQAGANEQGLLLKFTGGNNPNANSARWIEVTYDLATTSVRIFAKTGNAVPTAPLQTFSGVTLGAGDQLGARALADGAIIAYKNGVQIGTASAPALASSNGRIGVRFEGTGTAAASEARFDNFGGGTITAINYLPTVYEVGPGRPYATIQSAIDAAAGNPADDLVVVYPGQVDPNPRANPRGAYYENLIIAAPLKLQGVGPGGFQGNTYIPGSI